MFARVLLACLAALVIPATASADPLSPVLGETSWLSQKFPVSQNWAPAVASDGNTTFVAYSDELAGITFHRIAASGTEIGFGRQLQGPGTASVSNPKVASSGANVYVAWIQYSGRHRRATVAASHDGGVSFSAPQEVGRVIDSDVWDLQLAVDGDTVFVSYMDDRNRLWTAGSRDGGRTFPCTALVTPPGDESWWSWSHTLALSGGNVYWAWINDEYELFVRRSNDAGRTLQPAERLLDKPYSDFPGTPTLRAGGDRAVLLYGTEYRSYDEAKHVGVFGYEPEVLTTGDAGVSWTTHHIGDEASRCIGDFCAPPYSLIFQGDDVYAGWRGKSAMWIAASHDGGRSWGAPRALGPYLYSGSSSKTLALSARGNVVTAAWHTGSAADTSDRDALGAISGDRGETFALQTLAADLDDAAPATAAWGPDPQGAGFAWWTYDGEDTHIRFAPMSAAAPDVGVIDVRPHQVTQDAGALAAGRETTARVMVRSKSPRRETVKFKVELAYDDDDGRVEKTLTDEAEVRPGLNPVQLLADHPVVPGKGRITIKVTVEPETPDSDPSNNSAEGSRAVLATRPLKLLFVPVADDEDAPPTCTDVRDVAAGTEEYLKATWPVAPDRLGVVVDCAVLVQHKRGIDTDELLGDGELLSRIDRLKLAAHADKVVGVVPEKWFSHQRIAGFEQAVGISPIGEGPEAMLVERQNTGGWVVAHELAHNIGWTEEEGPHGNHLEEEPAPGYWVASKRDIPGTTLDFMQWSATGADVRSTTGRWMSRKTWDFLTTTLATARPLAAADGSLHLSGSVKDGAVQAGPMWESDVPARASGGPYAVEQLDAEGKVLDTRTFGAANELDPIGGGDGKGAVSATAGFSVQLPAKAAARTLRVKRGDEVLLTRERSAAAPVVEVDTPGKVAIGDQLKVTWTATDADGGTLTSLVSVSLDGGATWQPLGEPTTAGSLSVKATLALAAREARLRVTTTDGWNTTSAESGSFGIGSALTDGGVLAWTYTENAYFGSLDGGVKRLLVAGMLSPRLSPDGTRVAYIAGADVWIVNVDGRDAHRLTHSSVNLHNPEWMPDGESLLVKADVNVRVDAETGAMTPFAHALEHASFCGTTPDGSRLIVHGNYWFSLYRLDGTFDRELPVRNTGTCISFSPDMRHVVQSTVDDELFIVDVATGESRKLAASGSSPAWSPTGEWIVYTTGLELWKVHPDGTGAQLIMSDEHGLREPQVQALRGVSADPEPPLAQLEPEGKVAEAAGVEGAPVTLDASGSRPGADGAAITAYAWDLDGDGTFTDATGATPETTFPDEGTYDVRVVVTDAKGRTATASGAVKVTNAAPVITGAKVSETGEFSARVTDAGDDALTATLDGRPVPVIGGGTVLGTGSKLVVSDGDGGTASAEAMRVAAPVLAAPTADDGAVTVPAGTSLDLDLPAHGDGLAFEIVDRPQHGRVSLREPDSQADATYTADNELGTDTFTYRVHNAAGESRTATVTVTITARAGEPAPAPRPEIAPAPAAAAPVVVRPALVGSKPVDQRKAERAIAPVEAAATFTLPSTRSCVSRRHFRIRVKKGEYKQVLVWVNGKRVKSLRGKRVTATVDLRGLPKGRFKVKIAATLKTGKVIRDTRKYRTCAPNHKKKGARR
jgi:hypothetical protein